MQISSDNLIQAASFGSRPGTLSGFFPSVFLLLRPGIPTPSCLSQCRGGGEQGVEGAAGGYVKPDWLLHGL